MAGTGQASAAALSIAGASHDVVVRQNDIAAAALSGPSNGTAEAIRLDACAGAAPWIVENSSVTATMGTGRGSSSTSSTTGIRAAGDCHPVIESNARIAGIRYTGGVVGVGIHCGASGGQPSRCVIERNQSVVATYDLMESFNSDNSSVRGFGVICEDGGCARLVGNHLVGLENRGHVYAFSSDGGYGGTGLALRRTGSWVSSNVIEGGMSNRASLPDRPAILGVDAEDAWSRLVNNEILGGHGAGWWSASPGIPESPEFAAAVRVVSAAGGNELDVDSNLLIGSATDGMRNSAIIEYNRCQRSGLLLDALATAPPGTPVGVYRNNVIVATNPVTGACVSAFSVRERGSAADPRVFTNNSLVMPPHYELSGYGLYLDEGQAELRLPSEVNDLASTWSVRNLDGCAANWFPFRLLEGSSCIDAGGIEGAPALDIDGRQRQGAPDIGPREFFAP